MLAAWVRAKLSQAAKKRPLPRCLLRGNQSDLAGLLEAPVRLSSELQQTRPGGAAGPAPCRLEGDLGATSGKPDTLAAAITRLFSEVGGRALLRLALSVVPIPKLVAVSGVSLHDGAGQGKPTCGCPGILWGDSWLSRHRISKGGHLPAMLLERYKPGGPPSGRSLGTSREGAVGLILFRRRGHLRDELGSGLCARALKLSLNSDPKR